MFALSTKGRYATRAMLELSLRKGDVPARLDTISRAQKISPKYLGRIMTALVSAGLVRSRRGKNGGFELARPLVEISILNILQAVEGSVALAPCVENPRICRESGKCATLEVWRKVSETMASVLGGITLDDLASRHRAKKASASEFDYCI
jgi:Rrf2 family transcriptional regulator, cysteine metabolism repressor